MHITSYCKEKNNFNNVIWRKTIFVMLFQMVLSKTCLYKEKSMKIWVQKKTLFTSYATAPSLFT